MTDCPVIPFSPFIFECDDFFVLDLFEDLAAIAIERKRYEARLAYQAQHDPLTDLPNRTLFLEFLQLALARTRRRHDTFAVLFLDLDRFKLVNDSLGHSAGDRLLVAVADRLSSVMGPSDAVARFGGSAAAYRADVADPRIVKELEAGRTLVLELVDSNLLSLTTSLPLAQFAAVHKGAPAQTLEQYIDE